MKFNKLAIIGLPALMVFGMTLAGCGGSSSAQTSTSALPSSETNSESRTEESSKAESSSSKESSESSSQTPSSSETPSSSSVSHEKYQVTSEEWEAAFGLDKPYFFADNYKMDVQMMTEGSTMAPTLIVDGNKLKSIAVSGQREETYYNEYEDDKLYQYRLDEFTKKWVKEETTRSVADDFGHNLIDERYEGWEHDIAFLIQCEQFYLSAVEGDNKILPPLNSIQKRQQKALMGKPFEQWAEDYFQLGGGHLDVELKFEDVYQAYKTDAKSQAVDPEPFNKKMQEYCDYADHIAVFNPKDKTGNDKDGQRWRKHETSGQVRYIYVRSKEEAERMMEELPF